MQLLQPQGWDFNLCITPTYLTLSLFISFTSAFPSASLESMEMDASSADDGRIRTGTVWTATAHAFTSTVGSGILALPWSVAQLGWILGPFFLVFFAAVSYYIAILLCDCYRTPDPVKGRRNYTYMDAVRALLGPKHVLISGIMQYSVLWGIMIGFTITAAISTATLKRSACFHEKEANAKCEVSGNSYMIAFGALEILLSQFPNLEKVTFLSVIATLTSLAYALIALCLSIAKFSIQNEAKGTIMVAMAGEGLATSTKIWQVFQALGNIAFSYTYSMLLLEIQDTLKSPPAENKAMKRVTLYAIGGTALFYTSLGCMGYVAFGADVPGNYLTGFYKPLWLADITNLAVIIHLIVGYQVFAQTIFAKNEKSLPTRWQVHGSFFNKIYTARFQYRKQDYSFQFTPSRFLLRTGFVIFTTLVAMLFPFFNAILGLLGAISFWPLTVYFPLKMYMVQANIKRGNSTWMMFQVLSLLCLVVSLVSAIGSVADMLEHLKHAQLFHVKL
ncbi:PREDICTED: amino acid permease 4-like isoform X2 [Populus euphratica]|uniref:Amino acid permease 4-like isoform X2 n=1 Tax=Populus euphratica TaxID=75702 RepID=A0AAJ6T639_POPEU|nr:PREDICTED: amino acid permease 4-like isoform X2 [Populus euphratica]